MASRLINVRLDEERLRKARQLRQRGVILSDLVREAIDRRFEEMRAGETPRDVSAMLERLYVAFPDPPALPDRAYDVHDRRQAKEAIRARLERTKR